MQEPDRGDAGGAETADDDPDIFHPFPHHLQRVDQTRQNHHGRAVLIVVKDGDIQLLLQAALDLETAGAGDVLQADGAETGGDPLHRLDDLLRIPGFETDGKGVDSGEVLEEQRLSFHDRQRRRRPDIAEAEDGRAVRNERDTVLFHGQFIDAFRLVVNGHRHPGHARRVDHREIIAGLQRNLALQPDLSPLMDEQGPIRHVEDLDLLDPPDRGGDQLRRVEIRRAGLDIADDAAVLESHDVDGPHTAPGPADDGQDLSEHPRPFGKSRPAAPHCNLNSS